MGRAESRFQGGVEPGSFVVVCYGDKVAARVIPVREGILALFPSLLAAAAAAAPSLTSCFRVFP